MADTTATLGIQVTTVGVSQATSDLDKLNASQKNLAQGTKDLSAAQQQSVAGAASASVAHNTLAAATTASGQSQSLFQRILAPLSGIFGGATGSTNAFRESMRTLTPIVYSAGGNIAGLGVYGGAARAGLAGLAAVITASVIVSLERASDTLNVLKGRLADIHGDGAAKELAKLKGAADDSHSSLIGIAPVIEQINQLLISHSAERYFPEDMQSTVAANSFSIISKALQLSGMTATQATIEIAKYFDAIKKAGSVTADVFDMIYADSPKLANAIITALGGTTTQQGVADFRKGLIDRTISIDDFMLVLSQIKPGIDKAFSSSSAPNTVAQSFDRLKTSVTDLWAAIGNSGEGRAAVDIMGLYSAAIDRARNAAESGHSAIIALFTPPQGWQEMFAQLGDLILHALNLDGMRTAIKSFLDDADAMVASWASSIANSIASAFKSAVQKINAAAALLIKLTPSSPGNYGTNTTGQPSFDATGVNLSDTANLSDTSNLMNFAQGGLTQVTGPSGTDKTLVSFLATNGEIVAVGNPSAANAASGGSSGAAVSAITSPITAAINASTGQIVSAISTNAAVTAAATTSAAAASGPTGFNLTIPKGSMYGMPAGSSTYASQYAPLPYDPTPTPDTPDLIAGIANNQQYQYPTPYGFADGFDGYVGGTGGTDSKRVTFNASPGELVSVTPPNKAKGGNVNVAQHFYLSQAPGNTYMSASQMKRMMQMSSR